MPESGEAIPTDPSRRAERRSAPRAGSAVARALDRVTRLATEALRVPVALVSVVETDRVVITSQVGLPEPWASRRDVPHTHAYCPLVAAKERPLAFDDARHHRSADPHRSALKLGMIAFAGVPIRVDGHVAGVLSVADVVPRHWKDAQLQLLQDLADIAAAHIELHALRSARVPRPAPPPAREAEAPPHAVAAATAARDNVATAAAPQPADPAADRGLILLVDDEDAVRSLARRVLEKEGYRVIAASSGADALRLAPGLPGPIRLLLTDIVMPGMTGGELAERLCERFASLRVLYMSGYLEDETARRDIEGAIAGFLPKPFSPAELVRTVRRLLDPPATAPPADT